MASNGLFQSMLARFIADRHDFMLTIDGVCKVLSSHAN